MPDRKVLAGGVSGVLTWLIMLGLGAAGHPVPVDWQPFLVSAISSAIAYVTPPSQYDKIKRLDDALVVLAQDDPTVNVTKPPGIPTSPPGVQLNRADTAALNAEKRSA